MCVLARYQGSFAPSARLAMNASGRSKRNDIYVGQAGEGEKEAREGSTSKSKEANGAHPHQRSRGMGADLLLNDQETRREATRANGGMSGWMATRSPAHCCPPLLHAAASSGRGRVRVGYRLLRCAQQQFFFFFLSSSPSLRPTLPLLPAPPLLSSDPDGVPVWSKTCLHAMRGRTETDEPCGNVTRREAAQPA
jgi:hypothetical protein